MNKTASFISSCFLFRGLEDAITEIDLPRPVKYVKGQLIYGETDFRRALGILVSGKAKAMPSSGSNAVLNVFLPGAVFGAAAVFSGDEVYVSRISAVTDCKVVFLGEEELTRLFAKHPTAAVNYITFLSQKIRFLNGKLALFTQNDTESRVYVFLASNCSCEGECTYTGSMAALARNLGVGRTSLYRALESLEHKKLIAREGRKIKVLTE